MPKTNRKDKEDRFVDEYLVDLNATQAYHRSHPGTTDGTARAEGARLLAKPSIQEKISAAKAARAKRTHVTQDRIIRELSRIAFLDIEGAFIGGGAFKAVSDLPPQIRRAVKGIEVVELFAGRGNNRTQVGQLKKVRFESKVRALEILLEHVKESNEEAAKSRPLSFIDLVKKAQAAKGTKK
jgi:phage terminase small subunit